MIKAVVFDFDGVLVLDSDAVFKKEAWVKALGQYPNFEDHLREANQHFGHGKAGGRIEILTEVLRRLGESEDKIQVLVQQAAEAFDAHVQARILEAGLALGARECLDSLKAQGLAMYVNSGTANAGLERSVENLKLTSYFKKSLGSTKSKVENLKDIAVWESLEPQEILMVGDSASDFEAARAFGCAFVGISNRWNGWGSEQPFVVLPNIGELAEYVRNLN